MLKFKSDIHFYSLTMTTKLIVDSVQILSLLPTYGSYMILKDLNWTNRMVILKIDLEIVCNEYSKMFDSHLDAKKRLVRMFGLMCI